MNLKKIQDAEVEGKKILLRVDFNVSLEEQTVKEKFKVKACEDTLRYLTGLNAKVALVTHLGRPEGKVNPAFSLRPIKDDVEYILGHKVRFIDDCIGEKVRGVMSDLEEGEIALLENVRFYEGEEKNDEEFAKKLAENFEIYVNDAFSVSHRDQVSVTGVTKILPGYAGLWLQKEIEEMERLKEKVDRPSVAIIGGDKIETKLPVIKFFEDKFDYILLGGKVSVEAKEKKMEFGPKVVLPEDYVDEKFDIGPKTVDRYKEIIANAKTIVWNGPTGKFEEEKYAVSTNEILHSIILAKEANNAYVVVGGGETLEALEKNKGMNKVSFVSTGGGAMLSYLGGDKMPGIEVLQN